MVALAALLTPLGFTVVAQADPVERFRADQRGDFVMFGNILGHDCAPGTETASPMPLPVAGTGTVDCSEVAGTADDSSPDVFWSSNDAAGTAEANASVSVEEAGSTAVLQLPQGAVVTYARIYWAGLLTAESADAVQAADREILIERPGADLHSAVTADEDVVDGDGQLTLHGTWTVSEDGLGYWYQSTADITAFVAEAGAGPFRVSGVDTVDLPTTDNDHALASWTVVVFYEDPSADFHNLVIFDTLELLQREFEEQGTVYSTATIQGFTVPEGDAGDEYDAKLGVLAYEGEEQWTGDSLWFYSDEADAAELSDEQNPADNFFNASRSYDSGTDALGAVAVSNVGDLPQLTGEPNSLGNVDMDVVDVTDKLEPGQFSATIRASTEGDTYLLAAFVTSISTYRPEFVTSTKTLTDLDGGTILVGDLLEYGITVTNTGNDASIRTVVSDPLPQRVSFVEGSIRINGEEAPEQAEYLADEHRIVARIGSGATSSEGGSVAVGESVTITFQVRAELEQTIANQAAITYEGDRGASEATDLTDSDPDTPGAQPVRGEIVQPGDLDSDGLTDDVEGTIGTDPDDADSDDDGVIDGDEVEPTGDADGDGLMNALDPDSDDDGLFDGTEMGRDCSNDDTDLDQEQCVADYDHGFTVTNPLEADTDGGGVPDGVEDADRNGAIGDTETVPTVGNGDDDDSDRDGLSNSEEEAIDTDPLDADSDDDGVLDGEERDRGIDTDEDGLINALDPDSDDDGLYDGTEMGRDCSNSATDGDAGHCVADADRGDTTTNPLEADTDGGGVEDRAEDRNGNGAIDDGETNPTAGHGEDDDTDWDGLSDTEEGEIGTDPSDSDSDDDGVPDGAERDPGGDADDDGLINALDSDSDDDGLQDGTEMGLGCEAAAADAASVGTDLDAEQCVPDGDGGLTTTDPLEPDTDGGGVSDGVEDQDRDGVRDDGETDPSAGHGADDDSDWDGLSDEEEAAMDTDPADRDSDDDGVLDGQERDPGGDADEDGLANALDPDSDGDGLFDGTEMGFDCSDEDTSSDAGTCVADADAGETTTDPLNWDTDGGTVSDGAEDVNLDGDVDGDGDDAERNPNYRYDDITPEPPVATAGTGGQPPDEEPEPAGAAGTPVTYPPGVLEGGGCSCSVPSHRGTHGLTVAMVALGGLLMRRARRN